MPHSTQIRIRCRGWAFLEKSFSNRDITNLQRPLTDQPLNPLALGTITNEGGGEFLPDRDSRLRAPHYGGHAGLGVREEALVNSDSPRPLTFWMAVALVMGNMIGSGIFLLPASLARVRGVSPIGRLGSGRRAGPAGAGL